MELQKGVYLVKSLIVCYSTSEKGKLTSEDKVVLELEKLFIEKKISVKKVFLQPTKKIDLIKQFKQEKELELDLETQQVIKQIKEFDYVIIGSPLVGSFTSAPLVNLFIRDIPKMDSIKAPVFALFATGIIPGFGIKKMQSLLSMKGIKPKESIALTSMFEFDAKKMAEVKEFFERIITD